MSLSLQKTSKGKRYGGGATILEVSRSARSGSGPPVDLFLVARRQRAMRDNFCFTRHGAFEDQTGAARSLCGSAPVACSIAYEE
jgi:hypothetical protein